MPEDKPQDLGVNVGDGVKTKDIFGGPGAKPSGTAGTMHVQREDQLEAIGKSAWDLSIRTGLPVVIIVKTPQQVKG